jgi:hypothetical protein
MREACEVSQTITAKLHELEEMGLDSGEPGWVEKEFEP